MFFSGFMFPISSMPPLVQKLTYIIPLRYYITIVRGIFLKGVGWAELQRRGGDPARLRHARSSASPACVFRKQVR